MTENSQERTETEKEMEKNGTEQKGMAETAWKKRNLKNGMENNGNGDMTEMEKMTELERNRNEEEGE